MPDSIAIIHFQPLEWYPPVQNLIRFLESGSNGGFRVYVFSTYPVNSTVKKFETVQSGIVIRRLAGTGEHSMQRYLQYGRFYVSCIYQLIKIKPRRILYFETLSSYPAFLYKKYFNSKVEIFIHYHEYSAPEEYRQGMKLSRRFHEKEKWLYPSAKWVSHTNEERMERFIRDIEPVQLPHAHILPNYPPLSWKRKQSAAPGYPLRVVHAGSLGMGNMYAREFAEWVIRQNGQVVWDIYALQLDGETKKYLESLQSEFIHFKGAVPYDELPGVLSNYDVGIILYKGHLPNYIFNAPNKLFEYHMAGLDVWFPEQMITALRYSRKESNPRILALDFENLAPYDLNGLIKKDLPYQPGNYSAEQALAELKNELLGN